MEQGYGTTYRTNTEFGDQNLMTHTSFTNTKYSNNASSKSTPSQMQNNRNKNRNNDSMLPDINKKYKF